MRSQCFYNGEKCGIESIYKVIDGKRINIPDALEKFRKLGRENKLFCTCGCNANVTIVAGTKMLKAQHFRIKSGTGNGMCTYNEESETSIYTKINLKCWIENCLELSYGEVFTNVPISAIFDIESKYELTYYIKKYSIGVSYVRKDVNINDIKLELLYGCLGEKIIVFSDESNLTYSGQYPEYLKKILNVQGFCALICLRNDGTYEDTKIKIVYYEENYIGLWEYQEVIYDNIEEFRINTRGEFLYKDNIVKNIVEKHRNVYLAKQTKIKEDLEAKRKKAEEEKIEREKKQEEQRQAYEQEQLRQQFEMLREEENKKERIKKRKEKLSKEELFDKYPKYKFIFDFFDNTSRYRIKSKNLFFYVDNKEFQVQERRVCIFSGPRKVYILLRDSKQDRYRSPREGSGSEYIEIEASEMTSEQILSKLNAWCERIE